MRARLRGLLIDTSPLRQDRQFRLLWSGMAVSVIGSNITRVALPFQVFVLTDSTLAVAVLTGVQLVGILLFALGGGAIADAVDRRRLILVAQAGLAVCSLALAVIAALPVGPDVLPAILVIAFVAAGLSAADQPARTSSIPRLVPPQRLSAAIALNHIISTLAAIAAPALGGLLIAGVGLTAAYALDALTYLGSIAAVLRMAPLPPIGGGTRVSLASIRDGIAFARSRRPILGAFAIDLNAMIFGMPTALFPVLALEVFRIGPEGYGILTAAPAAGAFIGALLSGPISRIEAIGRGVVLAVLGWGAAITAFGLVTFSFPLAVLCLALAGGADLVSAVLRNTIIQAEAPDELRGRVSSINTLVITSGPRMGDIEAALVGALAGPQVAVVSGGLLCVAGVFVVQRWIPELAAYHRRPLAVERVPTAPA